MFVNVVMTKILTISVLPDMRIPLNKRSSPPIPKLRGFLPPEMLETIENETRAKKPSQTPRYSKPHPTLERLRQKNEHFVLFFWMTLIDGEHLKPKYSWMEYCALVASENLNNKNEKKDTQNISKVKSTKK